MGQGDRRARVRLGHLKEDATGIMIHVRVQLAGVSPFSAALQ
jgi:hypothetical protein